MQTPIPVLPVLNITDSIDFYEKKLGFSSTHYGSYAVLKNKNIEIHLVQHFNKIHCASGTCLILVENIEDLYVSLSAKDLVDPTGILSDKPWGLKEFSILDNNKNRIRFGKKR